VTALPSLSSSLSYHTVDYGPFIKSQLVTAKLTLGLYVVQIGAPSPVNGVREAPVSKRSQCSKKASIPFFPEKRCVTWFEVWSFGFGDSGFGSRVSGFGVAGLRVAGLGFRVQDHARPGEGQSFES